MTEPEKKPTEETEGKKTTRLIIKSRNASVIIKTIDHPNDHEGIITLSEFKELEAKLEKLSNRLFSDIEKCHHDPRRARTL